MGIISEVVENTRAIIKGMMTTASYIPKEKWTVQYPDKPDTLQSRFRGHHARLQLRAVGLLARRFVEDQRRPAHHQAEAVAQLPRGLFRRGRGLGVQRGLKKVRSQNAER